MTESIIESAALAYADRSVEQAYLALESAVEVLQGTLRDAQAAQVYDEAGVVKDMRAVATAFQLAIQQEAKARDAGSTKYGLRGAGELDLAAARAEVERRVARLRAARDDGYLS